MFVPFDRDCRIHLGVVALGTPSRLFECLAHLLEHRSAHDFAVSCMINASSEEDCQRAADLPPGVLVETSPANLGWAGGLHRLRALGSGEFFVFVQDDMVPEPGWLDGLVEAAEQHPGAGAVGALRVDETGRVLLNNGGRADPPDDVRRWNQADVTDTDTPTEVTVVQWVTSKGLLTRTAAFDEVGGPDPRVWPLHHVDKDYCTHLRCHGYDVVLAPTARLRHAQSQSAPSQLRQFLGDWRDPQFHERWTDPLLALGDLTSAVVDHPCAEWREIVVDPVEAAVGREASRMVVPFSRFAAEGNRRLAEQVSRLEELVAARETRYKRRRRALRRRIRRLEAELAGQAGATAAKPRRFGRMKS